MTKSYYAIDSYRDSQLNDYLERMDVEEIEEETPFFDGTSIEEELGFITPADIDILFNKIAKK